MGSVESEGEIRERCREERRQIVAKYVIGRDETAHIDDWEDPKFEIYHTQDRYGFIHDQRLPDVGKRSEREQKQISLEVSRSLKWADMMDPKDPKKVRKYFEPGAKYREKMINRIYKGVPDSVRGRLWYILLGIDEIKEQHPNVYGRMKAVACKHSPDIRQIDLDVNRTYRDHIMFRERYNGRQAALFYVLAAYSVYNTEVGYCQGMSQIAALLLMYLVEEEDAFWALHRLMVHPKFAMHGFFIRGFPKLLRFQAHHEKVMRKFLPKLKKHMDKHGIDSGIYTLKWFFQCFLDRIPFSLTLRVWDLYLLEGERVLIAMAYTILWIHRRKFMKMQMDEAIEYLQIRLRNDFGYDDDVTIDKLRENMHDLRSQRLDHPGRAPSEELPEKPFGYLTFVIEDDSQDIPPEKKPIEWTIQREAGLRTGFTQKEREFSQHTIQRQMEQENNNFADDDDDDNDDTTGIGSYDESSRIRPLRSTSTAGGHDFDTSFDTSDILPNNGGSDADVFDDDDDVVVLSKSPLPPSDAQDRLDDSVRLMLRTAADITDGRRTKTGSSENSYKRRSECEARPAEKVNNKLDTSFESYFGVERSASSDVVRIRVPYVSPSPPSATKSKARPFSQHDENRIRITVNHEPRDESSTASTKKSTRSLVNNC